MSTAASIRDGIPDLLTRPPNGTREFVAGWEHLLIDPVRQLQILADLFQAGLLSWSEYEQYKAHVRTL